MHGAQEPPQRYAVVEILQAVPGFSSRRNINDGQHDAGEYLQVRLSEALRSYEMVKEVRGLGLLMGIEFQAPRQLRLRIPYEAFGAVHAGMFGQMVVMRLFRDFGFLTQVCGNNFMVLKVAPPLLVSSAQMDAFVTAVNDVVELANSPGPFWSEALGLARRALRS